MKMNRQGFTLVEIMIVVAIIGILAAIAIPNFVASRKKSQANACISNLKQIESAKEQYMMNNTSVPANVAALVDANLIKKAPECPAGGTYTVGADGVEPTCDKGASLGVGFEHQLTVTAAPAP